MSSYKLPVLSADEMPLVTLESMNDTHREEIELINQLASLLVGDNADTSEQAISAKLDEWLEHTREHFAGENQLMIDFGFPAYPIHSGEHEQILSELKQLQEQWHQHKSTDQLAGFLFESWLPWFHQHVNSMDMATANFIEQAQRLKP